MPVCQRFCFLVVFFLKPQHSLHLLRQCGTLLTVAGNNNKKKKIIIIGYTLALLILRDRKLASEKYTIEVVTQNKVGGGHNLIGSSAPSFVNFQAFPFLSTKKKKKRKNSN